jgi:hypothetical protein
LATSLLVTGLIAQALAQSQFTVTRVRVEKLTQIPVLKFSQTTPGILVVGQRLSNPAISTLAMDPSPVTYTSSDSSIAQVDEHGDVTGLSPGSTTVTAAQAASPPGYQSARPVSYELQVAGAPVTRVVVPDLRLSRGLSHPAVVPVTASGGRPPLTFHLSPSLPGGLVFESATGAVSGVAEQTGSRTSYRVSVTDALGQASNPGDFALTISDTLVATVAVPRSVLATNKAATPFTPVTSSGGASPLSVAVAPALPPGLTLAGATGEITGTPGAPSPLQTYTVTITDTNGASAKGSFDLTVNAALTASVVIPTKVLTSSAVATSFLPVTAAGGTAPLRYTIAPTLPTGLGIAPASGEIAGTPSVTAALATYSVTITDADGATAAGDFTLTVNPPVTAAVAVPTKSLAVNQTTLAFTPVTGAGGTDPLGYAIHPGLPPGLTFAPATGEITGTPSTPAAAGNYVVTVADANGATASGNFALTVTPALTAVVAIPVKALSINRSAAAFTPVTASGGTNPLTYAITPALPLGLTMATASGEITGTPSAATTARSYTVTVKDAEGATATGAFTLSVDSALTATVLEPTKALTVNRITPAIVPVSGSGGTAPLSYTVTPTLPAGLRWAAATGEISGTPSAVSSATSYSVTVTDSAGVTASGMFSLTVNPALTTTVQVPTKALTVDRTVPTYTPVTASGGTLPLTFSVTPGLPAGLNLASSNGDITGTPTAAATASNYAVTVTDANGAVATGQFTLSVNASLTAVVAVPTKALATNRAAAPFTPVTASGGTPALRYAVNPALPTGLSLATATGQISGTPTVNAATATYTVTITEANNATAAAAFSLTVGAPLTTTVTTATVGLTAQTPARPVTPIASTGGVPPIVLAITPALPAALTLNTTTGLLSGSAAAAAPATAYTVTASDQTGGTSSSVFSLVINSPLTTAIDVPAKVVTANANVPAFIPVSASGGTSPLTYGVTPALPAGLTLNSASGSLSGTPSQASLAKDFTETVTDAAGASSSQTFRLTVNAPLVATAVVTSKSLTVSGAVASLIPVTVTGGTTPYTFAVNPVLPNGLHLDTASGTVSGTPTSASPKTTYSITAGDSGGATASETIDLSIAAVPIIVAAQPALVLDTLSTTDRVVVTGVQGTAPYTFAVQSGQLPPGITLDVATGHLTGKATAAFVPRDVIFALRDTNGVKSTNTVSVAVSAATLGVVRVGAGLTVGYKGLGCLTDGDQKNDYDNGCVGYRLIDGLGFVPNATYMDVGMGTPVVVATLSFSGYWRQYPAGSLGNWQMEGCIDNTCTTTVILSAPTPLDFSPGTRLVNTADTTTPYAVYRVRFVSGTPILGGPVGINGNFAEIHVTYR